MKRIIALVLSLVMALSLCAPAWGAWTGTGSGTEADPYQVSTEAELTEAVGLGGYIKLTASFATSDTFTIADGKTVYLDMNGQTITATDNKAATVCYELFYIYGEMNVTGNGTIELTSTSNDTVWAKSSTIFHNRGGVLTIENGTYKHLGGTCMAFVVDNSGNSYGEAVTNINGGSLSSSYVAIRNRMNTTNISGYGPANLNITDGTISGTSRAIWGQTAPPASGEVNISGGEVGLVDMPCGTGTVCMTTISDNAVVEAVKAEAGELKITGGTVTDSLTILDVNGDPAADNTIITGGTFGFDASAYVADNIAAAKVNDTYIVGADAIAAAATTGAKVTVVKGTVTLNNGTTLNSNSGEYTVPQPPVYYPVYVPTVEDTTEKDVTSAQTFDAGIALYVGVSVMGAIGTVALGKKRED